MNNSKRVQNYLEIRRDIQDGWVTSRQIQYMLGITPLQLRELCQNHSQTFLSSFKGYKLVKYASREELDAALRQLMSRSNKIMNRARSLQRYMLETNKHNDRLIRAAMRNI